MLLKINYEHGQNVQVVFRNLVYFYISTGFILFTVGVTIYNTTKKILENSQ